MKLGLLFLVVGVALMLVVIPYSIIGIVTGVTQLEEGIVSSGLPAWAGIIGVIAGFVLTTIGAVRVFKR